MRLPCIRNNKFAFWKSVLYISTHIQNDYMNCKMIKKLLLLITCFVNILNIATAQWHEQSFDHLLFQFNSVFFINKDTGWVAGSHIMFTNDGGNNWTGQFAPPHWYKENIF
jgi:hypothetical protein